MAERMGDAICPRWRVRELPPPGGVGPRCGPANRRLVHAQAPWPAVRGGRRGVPDAADRDGLGDPPAAPGHPRAGAARQRLHAPWNLTAPTGGMTGPAVEADARD
jgi:hypothetical protein